MGCIEPVGDSITISEADEAIKRGEVVFTRRRQRSRDGLIRTTAGHTIRARKRDPKLYEYTLARLSHETPTGSRYNALFGLAGVAWNCGIPKSRLERDMRALLDTPWAAEQSKDGKPLQLSDVRAALSGYNELGALRPRQMLENRLKWSYGPPQKRNGRNRHDHLWADWFREDENGVTPVVNTARENRRLASTKSRSSAADAKKRSAVNRLSDFLASNPRASKRSACSALHMSMSTASKYWVEACQIAGVPDERSGNHNPHIS